MSLSPLRARRTPLTPCGGPAGRAAYAAKYGYLGRSGRPPLGPSTPSGPTRGAYAPCRRPSRPAGRMRWPGRCSEPRPAGRYPRPRNARSTTAGRPADRRSSSRPAHRSFPGSGPAMLADSTNRQTWCVPFSSGAITGSAPRTAQSLAGRSRQARTIRKTCPLNSACSSMSDRFASRRIRLSRRRRSSMESSREILSDALNSPSRRSLAWPPLPAGCTRTSRFPSRNDAGQHSRGYISIRLGIPPAITDPTKPNCDEYLARAAVFMDPVHAELVHPADSAASSPASASASFSDLYRTTGG